MDRWAIGWVSRWMVEQRDGWMDDLWAEVTDGRVSEKVGGRMGWMSEWKDE